jgi:hypothetical protein
MEENLMPKQASAQTLENIGAKIFERLKSLQRPGENEHRFCQRIGINPTTWRVWELKYQAKKKFSISFRTLAEAATVTGTSPFWLFFGVESLNQRIQVKSGGNRSTEAAQS